MKSILLNKDDFEKDLLKVLKKYGFKTELVTKLQIKCQLEELPIVKIVYGKQYRCLKSRIKKFFNIFTRRI